MSDKLPKVLFIGEDQTFCKEGCITRKELEEILAGIADVVKINDPKDVKISDDKKTTKEITRWEEQKDYSKEPRIEPLKTNTVLIDQALKKVDDFKKIIEEWELSNIQIITLYHALLENEDSENIHIKSEDKIREAVQKALGTTEAK